MWGIKGQSPAAVVRNNKDQKHSWAWGCQVQRWEELVGQKLGTGLIRKEHIRKELEGIVLFLSGAAGGSEEIHVCPTPAPSAAEKPGRDKKRVWGGGVWDSQSCAWQTLRRPQVPVPSFWTTQQPPHEPGEQREPANDGLSTLHRPLSPSVWISDGE